MYGPDRFTNEPDASASASISTKGRWLLDEVSAFEVLTQRDTCGNVRNAHHDTARWFEPRTERSRPAPHAHADTPQVAAFLFIPCAYVHMGCAYVVPIMTVGAGSSMLRLTPRRCIFIPCADVYTHVHMCMSIYYKCTRACGVHASRACSHASVYLYVFAFALPCCLFFFFFAFG